MTEWELAYGEICEITKGDPSWCLFRGHSDSSWLLRPGLGRYDVDEQERRKLEAIAYYDFVGRSGQLLPETNTDWANLLTMQHHGVPTRLLDWSESFAIALHFALGGAKGDAAIWILNPYELNKESRGPGFEGLPTPEDLGGGYRDLFIDNDPAEAFGGGAVAIAPLRHHPRIFNQQGAFTLHKDLDTPLDSLYPRAVRMISIPEAAHEEAQDFLRLAGISAFSAFPDLDALARDIKAKQFNDYMIR